MKEVEERTPKLEKEEEERSIWLPDPYILQYKTPMTKYTERFYHWVFIS